MHILLAAATAFEIQPAIDGLPPDNGHTIESLITGVGGIATVYSLMRQIGKAGRTSSSRRGSPAV